MRGEASLNSTDLTLNPGTQRWKMEGEGNEAPAGIGRPEASTPSKPFLLRTQTEGRTSQEGGAGLLTA